MTAVTFKSSGSTDRFERSLRKMKKANSNLSNTLRGIALQGVSALIRATPRDSGMSAASWGYKIRQNRGGIEIVWTNTNMAGGIPVVVLLQYGHATGTGGYVQGRDFINPVMKPIFDKIADDFWKAVKSA